MAQCHTAKTATLKIRHIYLDTGSVSSLTLSSSRVVTSVGGQPEEYGVEKEKLRPFEKLIQGIEAKLLDGRIFEVCPYVLTCFYG